MVSYIDRCAWHFSYIATRSKSNRWKHEERVPFCIGMSCMIHRQTHKCIIRAIRMLRRKISAPSCAFCFVAPWNVDSSGDSAGTPARRTIFQPIFYPLPHPGCMYLLPQRAYASIASIPCRGNSRTSARRNKSKNTPWAEFRKGYFMANTLHSATRVKIF